MVSAPQTVESIRSALTQQRTSELNKLFASKMLQVLGIGAGVGAGARGLQGLYNLGRRNLQPKPDLGGPKLIHVPTEEEDPMRPKLAFMDGSQASTLAGHPLFLPSSVLMAGAGTLGGWKLTDWILDKQRKQELAGELDKAKQDYDVALMSAYHKQGSELGHDLDRLFDMCKEANISDYLPVSGDTAGMMAGGALTAALPLALASGLVTYNLTAKRNQSALVRKAINRHRREQQQMSPTPIYAVPTHLRSQGAPTEDELNGEPLDQAA